MKNGKNFLGDGGRVTLDYHSICFTAIKPEDAGQYSVEARVKSDVVRATSTLNGMQLWGRREEINSLVSPKQWT